MDIWPTRSGSTPSSARRTTPVDQPVQDPPDDEPRTTSRGGRAACRSPCRRRRRAVSLSVSFHTTRAETAVGRGRSVRVVVEAKHVSAMATGVRSAVVEATETDIASPVTTDAAPDPRVPRAARRDGRPSLGVLRSAVAAGRTPPAPARTSRRAGATRSRSTRCTPSLLLRRRPAAAVRADHRSRSTSRRWSAASGSRRAARRPRTSGSAARARASAAELGRRRTPLEAQGHGWRQWPLVST